MTSRREFLRVSGSAALALGALPLRPAAASGAARRPIVVSTWNFGAPANEIAWPILAAGGRALDAVEAGVRTVEDDPANTSVGYGGLPDRDGHVTLDACVMDERGNAGSVAFLEGIRHPVSVARRVMEKTPHVMLAGQGALRFALDEGFPEENLLTPEAEAAWRAWLAEGTYAPRGDARDHDTIGMLALDAQGGAAGACSTSGLAFKMRGRVGDSPLIGAGLCLDPAVGAACATGLGEEILKVVGSHLVVERMRDGADPEEACREAVRRLAARNPPRDGLQAAFLALRRDGAVGSCSLVAGFQVAVRDAGGAVLLDAPHLR